MKNNNIFWKILTGIVIILVVFHVGWNLGSLYSKEKPIYCVWKLTTNTNSFYPNAVIWEDAVANLYSEYELYQKVLKEGEIESIDTKCYILGELNPDGTRIEVEK